MNIDEELEKMDNEKWSHIKFEVAYFFKDLKGSFYSFVGGVKNFWKWRKIIYHDRWYDHAFLHNMLRFKLNDMAEGYKNCHYVDCEKDQQELHELVEILDKINKLEDESLANYEQDIDKLYEEFGERLFGIKEFHTIHDYKIHRSKFSSIRKFWD